MTDEIVQPQKAYDPKDLVKKFAEKGISVLESAAKDSVEVLFAWLHESAKLSTTPIDDILDAAAYPTLKDLILKEVDKIDGQVG